MSVKKKAERFSRRFSCPRRIRFSRDAGSRQLWRMDGERSTIEVEGEKGMWRKMWWFFLLGLVVLIELFKLNISQPLRTNTVALPWDHPPEYRIVYLVAAQGVSPDSLLAPSRLEATLGARTAHTWNDVLAFNQSGAIDALIIHDSALSLVDRDWLAVAYRRGVVIAAFNLYAPTLAELVDDPCIAQDGWVSGADPYPGQFYIIVSRLLLGHPDDINLIETSRACGRPVAGITRPVSGRFQRSTYAIDNLNDYNIFARELVNHIKGIKAVKDKFEKQGSP